MLGNRALEIRVKKDTEARHLEPAKPAITSDDITRIAKDVVMYVAMGTAATFASVITLNTVSKITVHHATKPPRLKH